MRFLIAAVFLGACVSGEPLKTKEGCPVYMTELMQAATQACVQAYYEEKARQQGQTVTKCYGGPGNMTCVTG